MFSMCPVGVSNDLLSQSNKNQCVFMLKEPEDELVS